LNNISSNLAVLAALLKPEVALLYLLDKQLPKVLTLGSSLSIFNTVFFNIRNIFLEHRFHNLSIDKQ
jgi:hypothetical protein